MYTLLLTIPSILVFTIYYLGGGDFVRSRELADTFLVSVVLTIFAIAAYRSKPEQWAFSYAYS